MNPDLLIPTSSRKPTKKQRIAALEREATTLRARIAALEEKQIAWPYPYPPWTPWRLSIEMTHTDDNASCWWRKL